MLLGGQGRSDAWRVLQYRREGVRLVRMPRPGGPGREAIVASLLLRLYRWALPSVRDWPGGPMSSSLYGYVLKVSRRQQVRLGLLTLAVFPLSLVPLELQRRIVN